MKATLDPAAGAQPADLYAAAEADFDRYQVLLDVIDECIDLTLNERQSGHPGGSRSKGHLLLATLLSGAMRWDITRPWRRFADRFVLSAGHTVPLVYATLAVLNEGLRARHEADGDPRFAFPDDGRWALTWEDLRTFRHRGGLPGHAEMAGKTLFFKANTGPSGHGMPFAAGQALALKMAGAESVKVFAVEGEGGLTPGASARDAQFGLRPGPLEPRPPGRLERLRNRRPRGDRASSPAPRRTGSRRTDGASSGRRTGCPGAR